MDWDRLGLAPLLENSYAVQAASLAGLVVASWIALHITRRFLVVGIRAVVAKSSVQWDDRLVDAKLFVRLGHLAPALIVYYGVDWIPDLGETISILVRRLSVCAIALVIALSISSILHAVDNIYSGLSASRSRPIKGYLQLVKLAVGIVTAVVIVATLFDKSPLLFLSGLGAMTAVLMLVFKDTILSLVASVQLTGNDMIRVGDWIEMPKYGADGDVVDIALHTVKVQNWDKTITTIPTHRLIEDSFKNWRGMSLAGGRRIKRSVFIDVNTIRFLEPADIESFEKYALLQGYVEQKRQDIESYNSSARDHAINANIRRLTNVGTFRAYIYNYLKSHPQIHKNMTLLVRQLDPTPQGLPIQIYCFTTTTGWNAYEDIQSDVMDHLFALAPDFGLRIFQSPSGQDVRELAAGTSTRGDVGEYSPLNQG
jgi:miniconductance mechanosensitive channel